MDDKKRFVIPEAELISFNDEDIITMSVAEKDAAWGGQDGDDWPTL